MSTEKPLIDETQLQAARANAQEGNAYILVIENQAARLFQAQEVLGARSWTAILGADPERIDLRYGHDVANGFHVFEATSLRPWYRAPDGELYYSAVEGEIWLWVDRPQFGTAFEHTGWLLNVRFKKGDGTFVVLNGTFRNSYT